MVKLTSDLPSIGIGFQIGLRHGWGVHGYYLSKRIIERNLASVIPLAGVDNLPEDDFVRQNLGPSVQSFFLNKERPIPAILSAGNNPSKTSANFGRHPDDALIICFEDENFTKDDIEYVKSFKTVMTLSSWNKNILLSFGIKNVQTELLGADTDLFNGEVKNQAFLNRFGLAGDETVIFSGGKLELRKGQDLVLAAFKEYLKYDSNAILAVAWGNLWPETKNSILDSPLLNGINIGVKFNPSVLASVFEIPEKNFVDLGFCSRTDLSTVIAKADLAVFPNRVEGATNQIAIECLASGIKTIASVSYGQDDLIFYDGCSDILQQVNRKIADSPSYLAKEMYNFLGREVFSNIDRNNSGRLRRKKDIGWDYRADRHIKALGIDELSIPLKPVNFYVENEEAIRLASHAIKLKDLGQVKTGIACARKALSMQPDSPRVLNDLANLLICDMQLPEAKKLLLQASEIAPEQLMLHINTNLGLVHHYQGQPRQAVVCLEKSAGTFVDAMWNLSQVLLTVGDWEVGFELAEVKKNRRPQDYISGATEWNGSKIDGTLLVYCEQGIGDIIQFSRYILWARQYVGHLVFLCLPKLYPLFIGYPGIDELVPFDDGVPLPEAEAVIPLMSLPRLHKTTVNNVPEDPRWFLHATQQYMASKGMAKDDSAIKVGLCWAGNSFHMRDRDRSIEFEQLLPILSCDNIEFHSLQAGSRHKDIDRSCADALIIDNAEHLVNWSKTCSILAQLDLLITVDTAVAHMAGAMGIPTWLLVSKIPDWRWLLDRKTTPWYLSITIYRQEQHREWTPVINRVRNDLLTFVKK